MDGMPMPGKDLPAIGDEIGKYRIESVLGQGGMGAVYSARNTLTGKRVAIKWLLPEHAASSSRERLLREAQIACSIEHPNVVDIYDVGEHQGGLFLVMEYLRGRPLSDVLAECGRMEPEELIALLLPAMRGVHAAHQAGVIHRDLKPENILLSEQSGEIVPKVVDFGVSKTIGASSVPHSSLTRTGALVGTPHYMALEQVDGSNQIDARTDVYAFGVILYRGLTGHYPFDGSSLGEVILKIGTKDAQPMRSHRPELSPELDLIVLKALSRARERRFGDLEAFGLALEPFSPGVRFHRDTSELRMRSQASGNLGRPYAVTHDLGSHPRSGATPASSSTPLGAAFQPAAGSSLGSNSGEGPQAAGARETPPPRRGLSRPRAFWIGAGAALLVLLLLAYGWSRAARTTVAEPAPATPNAPAPEPRAEVDAPVPAQAGASAPAQAEQEDTQAGMAPEPAAPAAEPLAAEPPADTQPSSAPPARRAAPRRVQREVQKTGASEPTHVNSKRIPGQRTKGLSVDDF